MNKIVFYKLLKSLSISNSISSNFKNILTKKEGSYRLTTTELDSINIYKIDNYTYFNNPNKTVTFTKIFDSKKNINGNITFIGGNNFHKFESVSFSSNEKMISELIKVSNGEITTVEDDKIPDLYLTKISSITDETPNFFSGEFKFKPFKISEVSKVDSFDIETGKLDLNNTNINYENSQINFINADSETTTFGLTEYNTAIVDANGTFILKEGNEYNIYCDNDKLKEFDHISYLLFGISDAVICFEEVDNELTGVKFTYENSIEYGDQIRITCNNLITDGYSAYEEAPNVS